MCSLNHNAVSVLIEYPGLKMGQIQFMKFAELPQNSVCCASTMAPTIVHVFLFFSKLRYTENIFCDDPFCRCHPLSLTHFEPGLCSFLYDLCNMHLFLFFLIHQIISYNGCSTNAFISFCSVSVLRSGLKWLIAWKAGI